MKLLDNVNIAFFENYLKTIHDSTSVCKLSQNFFLVELSFLFNFLTYKIKVLLYNLSLPSLSPSLPLSLWYVCVYVVSVSAQLQVRGQLWVPFSIALHLLNFFMIYLLLFCMYEIFV